MSEAHEPTTIVEDDNPDPRAPSTMVVGAVGVLLTIVTFIGLEVLYHKTAGAEFKRKEVESVSVELEQTREEQTALLDGYRWVDKDGGVVTLPIEQAMELVVKEHGQAHGHEKSEESAKP